jgi:hypothetical protein
VGNVGVAHQQAMITDYRVVVGLHGLMNRDVLADRVARADDDPAQPLGHVGMLGNAADHRPLEEMVFFAQRGPALNDDVAFQNALGADCHVILNNAEWSNLNAIAKYCRGSNQRQRVNTHNSHLEAVESVLGTPFHEPGSRRRLPACEPGFEGRVAIPPRASLGLLVLIGRTRLADLADYDTWNGFAAFSACDTPREKLCES